MLANDEMMSQGGLQGELSPASLTGRVCLRLAGPPVPHLTQGPLTSPAPHLTQGHLTSPAPHLTQVMSSCTPSWTQCWEPWPFLT